MKNFVIATDFDGTIVECGINGNKFPKIGNLKRNAKKYINKLYNDGHTIIINTCRDENDETHSVLRFLADNGIKYHFINCNDPERVAKYSNDSRKIGADWYIDDKHIMHTIVNWKNIYNEITKHANEVKTIFCIIGESGTGKTTVAEYIEHDHGIKMIESHTDRAKRIPDERGHTFLSSDEFDKLKCEDMLALTKFGGHRYCCLIKDVMDYNTYVIEEQGYLELLRDFGNIYNIIGIRLVRNESLREKDISSERMERDRGRFNIPLEDFNYVVYNNSEDQDVLFDEIDEILSKCV